MMLTEVGDSLVERLKQHKEFEDYEGCARFYAWVGVCKAFHVVNEIVRDGMEGGITADGIMEMIDGKVKEIYGIRDNEGNDGEEGGEKTDCEG